MLADIYFFNSLSPNMQAGYDLGNRSFSTFDNPKAMSEAVRKGGLFVGEFCDKLGIPLGGVFDDIKFRKLPGSGEYRAGSCSYAPTEVGVDKEICYYEPKDYNEPTTEHYGVDFYNEFYDTIIHELFHAVSFLNNYINPHREQIPKKEKAILKQTNPYALHEYFSDYGKLLEYVPTLFKANEHYDNVTKYLRKNAQLTTDEVINQPYSTIRKYLKTSKNPNEPTIPAKQLTDNLNESCLYASQLSNCANRIIKKLNQYSLKFNKEDMQEVPLVKDRSSSLYAYKWSGYFLDDKPTNGLYTKDNTNYTDAAKDIETRPKYDYWTYEFDDDE